MRAFEFDNTIRQSIEAVINMPPDYNGGDIRYRVKWLDNSATGTAGGTGLGVTWSLEVRVLNDGADADAPWSTPIELADDSQGSDQISITDLSAALGISGFSSNSMLALRLSRAVDDTNDDLDKDVSFVALQLDYGLQ